MIYCEIGIQRGMFVGNPQQASKCLRILRSTDVAVTRWARCLKFEIIMTVIAVTVCMSSHHGLVIAAALCGLQT